MSERSMGERLRDRLAPLSCALACGLGLCLWPTTASAHLVSTRFGELYGGIVHPLTTLVHLVPWLGLGLLGGLQAPATARWAPWVLPVTAGVGALLGGLLPPSPVITIINLASFLVLGGLLSLAVELAAPIFIGVTALFGLTHGYANGTADLGGTDQALYVIGVALSAHVLVTLVSGAAQLTRKRATWGTIALRAAGSWIVAIGLVFGGFSLISGS